MKQSLKKSIFTFVLILLVSASYSQLYNFHTYTVEDGLTQSQVRALYQGQNGSLWIGTAGGGVTRYNGKKYFNFTSVNGLADNTISSIIGDKWGHIWIGTAAGLSRYNGKEFKNFSTKNGMPNSTINALCVDSAGNVWAGTDEGLCILIPTDSSRSFFKFSSYFAKNGLPDNTITSLYSDKKGKVWVGTNKGVVKADSKNVRNCHFTLFSDSGGIINGRINSIVQDQNGYMWFAGNNGVSKLISKGNESSKFLNYTVKNGLISNDVNSITADSKGNLWFAAETGITRVVFENNTNTLQVINYNYKSGLPEATVNTSFEDREGNIWFGTENGLTRYSGSRFVIYTKDQGLQNNVVWSIVGDKDGNLLIGTDDGLCKLNLKNTTSLCEDLTQKYHIPSGTIRTVFIDRENNIWLGTENGVVKLTLQPSGEYTAKLSNDNENFNSQVNYILEDTKGNIWFATTKGLISYNGSEYKKYTKGEGLPDDVVLCLMEDRKGTLWVGTEKGLCNFDGHGFTKFGSYTGLKLQVASIVEDEDGNLWLGSNSGGGVTRFDGENYINISEADGLISNTVYLLSVDNSGKLWVGTNKGLDLFDINHYNKSDSIRIRHYTRNEGFTSVECNQNAVYKDFSGKIWFGTVKGAVMYDPEEDVQNTIPPFTRFTSLKLFNKEDVDWSKFTDSINPSTGLPVNPIFPYDQNTISFSFLGISLTNPERVRYKYKLEGNSDEWSEETSETTVALSRLDPGKYTFYVMACNNDGIWNKEPLKFSFIVSPPFWKTIWFYVTCVISLTIGIWRFISWRTNKLQKDKKLLEQKIDERTRELKEKNIELDKLSIVARETVNAVAIATPSGEIEWLNESFTRITGYTLEDLRNNNNASIYQASNNAELKKVILDCVSNKQSRMYEVLNQTKEGKDIWIHTTLTPIFDENGRVKKLVFIDTDITETKQAEEIIRQKNKDMMDSINYAKLIQDAILPTKEDIHRALPESFIFFQPREVVSGDFYWFNIVGDRIYLAVADSTGHGVPGAFMSLIGSTLLNDIVNQKNILEPDKILNELHVEIRKVLKQGKEGVENRDGMDIVLIAINLHENILHYSGAMRPLYIINKKEIDDGKPGDHSITEIPPDKRSIGGDQEVRISQFTLREIKLKKGDTIYMFTDGYADQFGGPKGKKITNARFKEALLSLQILSMKMQGKLLEQDLKKWMRDLEQVDDILVMGVKF
ncbi:MAG: PAS domain-containing protein [Bacteroidia bacterium]|nr:PAS domain-containing protein [Bacteroidia bacterium]